LLLHITGHVLTTSGTFSNYILLDITKNQSGSTLGRDNDRAFVVQLLPDIIENRFKKLNGFPSLGPDLVVKILDRFITCMGHTTDEERETARRVISKALGMCSRAAVQLFVRPIPEQIAAYAAVTLSDEAVCVAVALRDRVLIVGMLRMGGSPWGQTSLFGYTWEFVVNHSDLETLRYLISNSNPSTAGKIHVGQKYVLGRRIAVILGDGKEDAALELLKLYFTRLAPLSVEILTRCFDTALITGSAEIIERSVTDAAARQWHDLFRNTFLSHYKYPENVVSIIPGLLGRSVIHCSCK
jgi:hypothetical protein